MSSAQETFPTSPARAIPIGFQLYTVRGEFSRDVPGTLRQLGELGYQAVEFWGYAGTPTLYQERSAREVRKMLDASGLKCCGIHIELKALAKENLARTFDVSHQLANHYLIVAGAKEKMATQETIAELASQLNEVGPECKSHNMRVGYHAHPFDFVRINGRLAWELLFERTLPEVNMQMDVGNCLAGGGDPIAMLNKFPGRTPTIHIKEHEDKTFESAYYREVFRLCEASPITKWYIVEMGGDDGNAFDVPRKALAKLHQLGK